jgi:hypothetical protein
MKVAELLALPVGQRLRWDTLGLRGIVSRRDGPLVHIRLSDGVHIEVDPDDEDLVVLARCLEQADKLVADRTFSLDSWD